MPGEAVDTITEKLVETGTEITGNVGSTLVGLMIAGPPGALIGGVSGPIITSVLKGVVGEIKKRILAPREEVRIGAVFTYAVTKLIENEEKGKKIRSDDEFFKSETNERAASQEILEGVMLTAQKEYEERKIKFLGNLYANICSTPTINREHSNQLIKAVNTLSYRQLCILQLLKEEHEDDQNLNFKMRGAFNNFTINKADIIAEIRDLQQRGLVSFILRSGKEQDDLTLDDNSGSIRPETIKITMSGIFFCEILSLEEIERKDLDKINQVTKIKALA